MLKITRSYAETSCIQASLLRLPFADSSFDVILSIGTSMHVPSVEIMLREIYRTLKPERLAVISSSNTLSLYTVWTTKLNPFLRKHQGLYHRKQFTYWEFRRLLKEAGFTIFEARGFSVIPPLSLLPGWRVPIIPLLLSRGVLKLLDPFFSKWFGHALTFVVTK